jgi:hypothetical protein
MCGRYSITLPPEAIREIFQTHGELPNWPVYYNAPPTTALPVVRQAKDGGGRELALLTWGLIPWFSKDGKPSFSTINARAEGLRTAASYKDPFARVAAVWCRRRATSNGPAQRTIDSRTTSRAPMVSRWRLPACGIGGAARTSRRQRRRSRSSRPRPASSPLSSTTACQSCLSPIHGRAGCEEILILPRRC